VDYVAMDIKNSMDKYDVTAGTDGRFLAAVKESVDFLKSDVVPYEFRTTVTKNFHSKEEFEKIGKWLKGTKKYYLQSFVDSGDLICPGIVGCDEAEMKEFLAVVREYIPEATLRGI